MDQILKVESIAAGGALIISAGSFWYLNNKLSENDDKLKILVERFSQMVAKIHQNDEDIKLAKTKYVDMDSLNKIKNDLNMISNNFSSLTNEINDTFKDVQNELKNQEKHVQFLDKKLNYLYSHLGIEQEEESEPVKTKKTKIKKTKPNPAIFLKKTINNTEPLRQQKSPTELLNTKFNNDDLLKEMDLDIPQNVVNRM